MKEVNFLFPYFAYLSLVSPLATHHLVLYLSKLTPNFFWSGVSHEFPHHLIPHEKKRHFERAGFEPMSSYDHSNHWTMAPQAKQKVKKCLIKFESSSSDQVSDFFKAEIQNQKKINIRWKQPFFVSRFFAAAACCSIEREGERKGGRERERGGGGERGCLSKDRIRKLEAEKTHWNRFWSSPAEIHWKFSPMHT